MAEDARLVGIGAGGDLEAAKIFVSDTGTRSLEMYWDPTYRSWELYEILHNSQFWVLGPDGTRIETFVGFDESGLLDSLERARRGV